MNINWLNNIEDQLLNYLYSLQDNENVYHFLPARSSLTEAGKTLTLGFSCYSMKLHYILNLFTKINMNSAVSMKTKLKTWVMQDVMEENTTHRALLLRR